MEESRASTEGNGGRRRSRREMMRVCVQGSLGLTAASPAAAMRPLRLGLSESLIVGVNISDARAAMTVWLRNIAEDTQLPVEMSPAVFDTSAEILRRVRNGQVDAVAMNALEYKEVAPHLDASEVAVKADPAELQFVIAVKGGSMRQLADLRNGRLIMQQANFTFLASAWLDTLLSEQIPGAPESFFRSIIPALKPAQVILPVFFGQAEAGITTNKSFQLMCELNPQLGRQIKLLAVSPPLVSSIHAFHRNYAGPYRDKLVRILSNLPSSISGKQLMVLFQTEKLVMRHSSCLDGSLAVLGAWERLRKGAGAASRKGDG